MIDQHYIDNNITVVIRSVGERTEELCREIIGTQIAQQKIFLVREKPFACAVQRTFQIGIEQGRRWTLAVDADTLLLPGAIQYLCEYAVTQEADFFKAQGLIIDKFLSNPRPAGPHLYCTAHLPAALSYIPECFEDLRPETFILKKMEEQGFPVMKADIVIGFHDFEQYYCDIFRKIFLHSKKHTRDSKLLKTQWAQLADNDYDYAVALSAYESGLNYRGAVTADADSVHGHYFDALTRTLNIHEKPPLDNAEHYVPRISRQIGSLLQIKDTETFNMKTSFSFKLGRVLTFPVRKIINSGTKKS
jgi:hypothetical protein